MKRLLTVLGVLVAVFATITVGTLVYTNLPESWSVPFPGKTKVRVHAPPAAQGEEIRFITYASKDSNTPEEIQIEYKNGVTGYEFYRADGTLRETTEYWPLAKGAGQRVLKSGSTRSDDGTMFMSDRSFRPDGSREREGKRLEDGSYQIDFFFADGSTLERHQLVGKDGKPLLEQVYRDNGVLKGFTQVDATGKMTITTYFADGKTESVTIVPSTYWENIWARYYFPDGVNIAVRYEWTTYNKQAIYYRLDGTRRLMVEESNYATGNEVWTHFDDKGRMVMRQIYRVETKVDASTGKPVRTTLLRTVEEFDAAGKETREISFAADGRTPNQVFIPKPPGSYWGGTRKTFRADGSLEKVEEKNNNGDVVSTKTYTAQENVRERFPDAYLVRPVEPAMPTPPKKPATPPPYYYDYP